MTITPYLPDEHYPIVSAWYEAHYAPTPEKDTLVSGLLIPDRGAIFFYDDPRSPALLVFFVVTNPAHSPSQSRDTIAALILASENHAHSIGKRMILSFSGKPTLAAAFTDSGWKYIETIILTAKSWHSQH
jgi:hypothetical protein